MSINPSSTSRCACCYTTLSLVPSFFSLVTNVAGVAASYWYGKRYIAGLFGCGALSSLYLLRQTYNYRQLATLAAHNVKYEQLNQEHAQEIKKLKEENHTLSEHLKHLQELLSGLGVVSEQLTTTVKAHGKELEALCVKNSENLEKQSSNLQTEKEIVSELKNNETALSKQVTQINLSLQEHRDLLTELTGHINTWKSDKTVQKQLDVLSRLQDMERQTTKNLAQGKAQLAETEKKLQEQITKLQEIGKHVEDLQRTRDEMIEIKDQLHKETTTLTKTSASLQNSAKTLKTALSSLSPS